MSAGEAIDWVALETRYAKRPGAVDRLVVIALESMRESPAELRALAQAQDLGGLARLAHGLRGGAPTIQATLVGQLATQVETACRGDAPQAAALALQLAGAVDSLLEALERHARR